MSRSKPKNPAEIRRHDRAVRAKRKYIRQARAAARVKPLTTPPTPGLKSRRKRSSLTVVVPQVFCFLADPNQVLEVIDTARELTYRTDLYEVIIDFGACEVLGLGAVMVLHQTLADGIERLNRTLGVTFELLAIPSKVDTVNRILNAPNIGFASQPASIIRSPTVKGRPLGNGEFSKQRDRAGTEIVTYLDRCLHTEGLALTPDGCKYIGNLVTEALGNAEDHSGPWTAQGFFLQEQKGTPGECHLLLFNTGATIYERMTGDSCSSEVREDAKALAKRHLNKGFFLQRLFRKWDEEALVTLFAQQEGVSSRLHERPSRGNGTIEVIRAFSELAGTDQRMCILSGRAYILFDGTYDLAPLRISDTETRKIIAFNEANDLEQPPNEEYVYSLARRFPGTIVTMRFRLEKDNFKKLASEEDEHNV